MTHMITRDKALEIVNSKLTTKNLINHCLATEASMRALAKRFNEDSDKWGLVGLMHDADWDVTRNDIDQHTHETVKWLKEAGEDDESVLQAILSHNYKNNGANPPQNNMEWSLYCCDELTGFIVAVALIRPEKKLELVEVKSILKRFPQKAFAAGVHREQIQLCEEKLGIKLEEFVTLTLNAMKEISPSIGL